MLTLEILVGINSLLLAILGWLAREWWRSHREQHRELAEVIAHLKEVYASRGSVERAHQRLDGVEASMVEYHVRLTHIETRLALPDEACANGGIHRGKRRR